MMNASFIAVCGLCLLTTLASAQNLRKRSDDSSWSSWSNDWTSWPDDTDDWSSDWASWTSDVHHATSVAIGTGAIIGIVIAIIMLMVMIGLAVWCIYKRRFNTPGRVIYQPNRAPQATIVTTGTAPIVYPQNRMPPGQPVNQPLLPQSGPYPPAPGPGYPMAGSTYPVSGQPYPPPGPVYPPAGAAYPQGPVYSPAGPAYPASGPAYSPAKETNYPQYQGKAEALPDKMEPSAPPIDMAPPPYKQ